jgi:competence protein ComEA
MVGGTPPWRVLEHEPETTPAENGRTSPVVPWPIVVGAISVISLAVAAVIVVATLRAPLSEAGPPGSPSDGLVGFGDIVVEVEGAVARPGVYRLPDGSRIADAIAAAGGYSPRVDAASAERDMNLAAIVVDGDRVVVPSRDARIEAPSSSVSSGQVDLNRATQTELEALPGIGPVTAERIIAARAERPFRSVDELIEREVVGKATFEKIRDLVAASG